MSRASQHGSNQSQERLHRPSNMRHTQEESVWLSYHHLTPQTPGNPSQERLHRPSNMRHAQQESAGLSYYHLAPQSPRSGAPTTPHASQIPAYHRKPLPQRPQEQDTMKTQAQKEEVQKRPSLLARALSSTPQILRLRKRGADTTQSSATEKPGKERYAPEPSASSGRPGSMLPVAVGNAHRGDAKSSHDCRVSDHSLTRRASDKAWEKLTRGASAVDMGPGLHTAPRKLPFFNQPRPLRKKQSHASLRQGLEHTNQTLLGLSSLPATSAGVRDARKPSASSSKPEAPYGGVDVGQNRQHRTVTTVPERLRPYVTRDRFPIVGSGVEERPRRVRQTSASFDVYGGGQSSQPRGLISIPTVSPLQYERRRQSTSALRQYATMPLLSGEGLRRSPPALQATSLPSRTTHRLQRPMMLGDASLQAQAPQRPSAMRKAPVPLYAHQKRVQFHDAPEYPPLVHTTSAPVLRKPVARPSLHERSASASARAHWYESSSEYDVHSAVSSNAHRHPSIDHVLGRSPPRTVSSGYDTFSFTRSERSLPGEGRRPSAAHSSNTVIRGTRAVSQTSTVSARSEAYFDALSVQRTDSDKYRRSNSYPPASPSRLPVLAPSISVPNMRQRNGSISSMDYGRLGVAGITNRMTVIATPASATAADQPSKDRMDSAVVLPLPIYEGPHERYCSCATCPPHANDCICKICYEKRARRIYKSCKVYERIDVLASTCERLIPLLAELPDPKAGSLLSLDDLGTVKSFADFIATVPPPDKDNAFYGMPETEEEQRFEYLIRMITTWEQSARDAEAMLQGPGAEDSEVRLARVATRVNRPWASQQRYRHQYHGREPPPMIPEESAEEDDVPMSPPSRNVATNF